MEFKKAPRREVLELQLTAMVDIFSIMIIFLILGTVFGVADLPVPAGMLLPKSISRESIESGPRVTIHDGEVYLSVTDEKYKLSVFKTEPGTENEAIVQIKDKIKKYLDSIPKETKGKDQYLNVVANRDLPYADLFDVIKVMRSAGFESVLFIAMAGGAVKNEEE